VFASSRTRVFWGEGSGFCHGQGKKQVPTRSTRRTVFGMTDLAETTCVDIGRENGWDRSVSGDGSRKTRRTDPPARRGGNAGSACRFSSPAIDRVTQRTKSFHPQRMGILGRQRNKPRNLIRKDCRLRTEVVGIIDEAQSVGDEVVGRLHQVATGEARDRRGWTTIFRGPRPLNDARSPFWPCRRKKSPSCWRFICVRCGKYCRCTRSVSNRKR